MISYKDMTFCTAYPDKCANKCAVAYTEEVKEAALKWWGKEDPPVSISDFDGLCKDQVLIDT